MAQSVVPDDTAGDDYAEEAADAEECESYAEEAADDEDCIVEEGEEEVAEADASEADLPEEEEVPDEEGEEELSDESDDDIKPAPRQRRMPRSSKPKLLVASAKAHAPRAPHCRA